MQPARPWPRWLRIALVLCISLGAHASLLWLAGSHFVREAPKRKSQPISLIIRERPSVETPRIENTPQPPSPTPPEVVTRAPEVQPSKTRDKGPRGILDFPELGPTREPTVGTKRGPADGSEGAASAVSGTTRPGPGDVNILDGKAASGAAGTFSKPEDTTEGPNLPQRGELTAAERAEDALARMKVDQAAEQHAKKPAEAPPELVVAQAEADRTWNPPSTAVAGSRQKCKTCQHEIGRLSAIVDVSRSDGDSEATIIVAQPSGDPAFDKSAVEAVKAALPTAPKAYVWSRWRFNAEVYRWSASDMLLDPSFKPPGRKLPSSGLGAMSMTTSVRLVAFR